MTDNNQGNLENNDDFLKDDEVISAEEKLNVLAAEEEIAENKEFITSEEIKAEGKVFHYTKVILGGVIDQVISLGLALVLFGIFDLILKVFGYEIIMRQEMYMIMYVISNVLYYPIIAEALHGKTLGKKLLFR